MATALASFGNGARGRGEMGQSSRWAKLGSADDDEKRRTGPPGKIKTKAGKM